MVRLAPSKVAPKVSAKFLGPEILAKNLDPKSNTLVSWFFVEIVVLCRNFLLFTLVSRTQTDVFQARF